jgi:hypothetical protein
MVHATKNMIQPEEEIMSAVTAWMELENIILSEISQI